ncbi:hypothetical protein ScPMuIL_014891 [Solemya velum]
MTVAGSCPGMVLAQVGAGAGNAVFTLTGALCGAFVYGMLEPTIVKLTRPTEPGGVGSAGDGLFQQVSWPPYMAGILIGMLQVPTILFLQDTLGGSSSYCTLVSQTLFTRPLRKMSPYLLASSLVLYVAGAVVGAYASSMASASYGSAPGISVLSGFTGGFLLVFGARLASGCTSGHGLSGMGLLNTLSISATAAMFAGGMGSAFLMKMFGIL